MFRSLRTAALAAALLALALVLAGCAGNPDTARHPTASTTAGMSASTGEAVDITTLPPQVAARYRFIEQHQQLARRIPCYCGCGNLGHRDLADCFIRRGGGYESHAVECGVCVAEAQDVENMLAQGMNARAIRERIDTVYAPMGPGTDTPKP